MQGITSGIRATAVMCTPNKNFKEDGAQVGYPSVPYVMESNTDLPCLLFDEKNTVYILIVIRVDICL